MRVLLTGATGFLGSRLARELVASGAEVVVLKRHNSRLDRLRDFFDHLEFHAISNEGMAEALGNNRRCDAVIHAATCYGRGDETWAALAEANVHFPLRLLEKSIEHGVKVFLNIDTALDANVSAYAISKHQFADWGRMATMGKHSLYFINARLEHFYGPADDKTKFVTTLIHQCLAHTPRIPLTEGRQKRNFIHVDDIVTGLKRLLQAGYTNQIPSGYSEFDIGSGDKVTIRSFAELVHRLSESRSTLDFGAIPYRANECMESKPNIEPLKALGWNPKITLEAGLTNTINMERNR